MARSRMLVTLPLVVLGLLAAGFGFSRAPEASAANAAEVDVAGAIRAQLVEGEPVLTKTAQGAPADEDWLDVLRALYAQRGGEPIWSREGALRPEAAELLDAISEAPREGLDPADYRLDDLRRRLVLCDPDAPLDPATRARHLAGCELLLTRSYLTYGEDLLRGRLEPRSAGVAWYTEPRQADLPAGLLSAVEGGELAESMRQLAPEHPGYTRLRDALAHHREIEARGGWGTVIAPANPGNAEAGPAVMQSLRTRLERSGDLRAGDGGVEIASSDLFDALRAFQRRHGLAETGKLDTATLAELNVPVSERIRQIELNLERWRWLPESLGERYLMVNVPAFELTLVEAGAVTMEMRVVVGKTYQQTPSFSDTIEGLELNPYWNVPPSIERSEILPAIGKDPDYLAKEDMEVVEVAGGTTRIRQRPGPKNALGSIKFVLPNHHNIYLHDTPAEHLFSRNERDFSHGCIRLEAPMDLADRLVAGDTEWDSERIRATIATGENKSLRLARPIPVHIFYWTTWVDEKGVVQFRNDLYRVDEKLERALNRPLRSPDPAV